MVAKTKQKKSREEIDRARVVTGIGSCTREDQRELGKMLGCNICAYLIAQDGEVTAPFPRDCQ